MSALERHADLMDRYFENRVYIFTGVSVFLAGLGLGYLVGAA